MFSHINQTRFGKALPVQVSHRFSVDSAVFDDDNLVSCAGLVPVMALAERTGLSDLLAQMVHIATPRIKSGSANPAPKLATLIAGMCAGADCIDDIDVLRSGGMKTLFDVVYAPSTIGTLLREFTFGHGIDRHLRGQISRIGAAAPGRHQRVHLDQLPTPVQLDGLGISTGIDTLTDQLTGHAVERSSDLHMPIRCHLRVRPGRNVEHRLGHRLEVR